MCEVMHLSFYTIEIQKKQNCRNAISIYIVFASLVYGFYYFTALFSEMYFPLFLIPNFYIVIVVDLSSMNSSDIFMYKFIDIDCALCS